MKKNNIVILLLLLVSVVTMTSCDSKKDLAKNIVGSWSTNSLSVPLNDALNAANMITFEFMPMQNGENQLSGDFILCYTMTVTNIAAYSDAIVEPYSVSASGEARIKGTWNITDDDEINLSFNPNDLQVMIDPNGVKLTDNVLTGEDIPEAAVLKSQTIDMIKRDVLAYVKGELNGMNKIDDIEIKKGVMKCEMKDKHYEFLNQAVKLDQ